MKAFLIIWYGSRRWNVSPEMWPERILAEASLALARYKNPAITHEILEVTLPESVPAEV